MLVPIHKTGAQPPLFLVHGSYGVAYDGKALGDVLGPEQPLYTINARGFDGHEPPCRTVEEMAAGYAHEIERERPVGPLLIGGFCRGCAAAIELARLLAQRGRIVGTLILVDPAPFHSGDQAARLDAMVDERAMRSFRDQARYFLTTAAYDRNLVPFRIDLPDQLRVAVDVGCAVYLALIKYRPVPYLGPVDLIIASSSAPGYFNRAQSWQSALPLQRIVHVLRGQHEALFHSQRHNLARLISFFLETALHDETGDPGASLHNAEPAQ